jgi:hypothetical protein
MRLLYEYLFPAMWFVYLAYWWTMAAGVKATERREAGDSRLIRLFLMASALALLALPRVSVAPLNLRFLPRGIGDFWVGAVLTAAGLTFSVWARRHLGKSWSQAVTLKEGHELITSGLTPLFATPSTPGCGWHFLVLLLPVANCEAYSRLALFSEHSGAS